MEIHLLIIVVTITALLGFGSFSLKTASLLKQTTQASFLVQGYMEAIRNYRDNTGWNDDDLENLYDGLGIITTGVSLNLKLSEDVISRWQLLSGVETIGIFTRDVVIEPTERNGLYNIVESGGIIDPETKKATVTVSWQERGEVRELKAESYFTNWR